VRQRPQRTGQSRRVLRLLQDADPAQRGAAKVFFHNGVFHSLKQVVEFYAQRDIDPGRWYSRNGAAGVRKFDDLPRRFHDNVLMTPPFGGRVGEPPRLSDAEVRDIVAFLQTLTDGWQSLSRPPEHLGTSYSVGQIRRR